MTLNVALSDYDEVHILDPEQLEQGPICLAPATADQPETGQPIAVRSGLWVFDAGLGDIRIDRHWLVDGETLPDQAGTGLDYDAALAGAEIVHVETVQQGQGQIRVQAIPTAWPPIRGEWLVTPERRVMLDGITPRSGTFDFRIETPGPYAGDHQVDAADLGQGPACIVPPAITGEAAQDATLQIVPGLWVSMSDDVTRSGEWFRDAQPTGVTGDEYPVDMARDGGCTLTYRETVHDAAGQRVATSGGISASLPVDEGWAMPALKDADRPYAGLATANADGSVTVTTKTGNSRGYPRVCFDVEPGQSYQLETELEFGDASRVIGRLSDASGYNDALDVNVFDVTRAADQTRLVRSDVFTPTAGRIAMHYAFVMGPAGTARILSSTRVKKVN